MLGTNPLRTLAAAALTCGCLAAPTLAAPGGPSPIAAEQIGGTVFALTPQLAYESAVLKLVGPAGYQVIRRFGGGDPIRMDLHDGLRIRGENASPTASEVATSLDRLVDGQYRYELFLDYADGERTVFQGLFYVEGGVAVSRSELRSRIASLWGELTRTSRSSVAPGTARSVETGTHGEVSASGYTAQDFLEALDDQNDGTTYLTLHSDHGGDATLGYWHVWTDDGDLKFDREIASGGGPPGTSGLTLDYDSASQQMRVGIGTAAPTNALDITANSPIIQFTATGVAPGVWRMGASGSGLSLNDRTGGGNIRPFGIQPGTPTFTLELAPSGVGIGTGSPEATLHVNGSGIIEGDVALGSSRTVKHEIEALDPAGVLNAVRELPLYAWKYRDDPAQAPHIGPMAEDVHAAFGVGRDEKHLSPADTAGLALAAIQGLDARLDRELEELRARNTNLATENRVLRQRFEAIERHLNDAARREAER